jgi:Secretion system C-terminal sorting domain
MKKIFTVLSAVAISSLAHGQVRKVKTLSAPAEKISKIENGKEESSVAKAGGDVLWTSDFSVPANWTLSTLGQGDFVIGNNTSPGIISATGLNGYMGSALPSATQSASGYGFFNGVQFLIAPEVPADQDAFMTSASFATNGATYIDVSFFQKYRAFNFDIVSVEFSGDNGTTWTSADTMNATSVSNGAGVSGIGVAHLATGGAANGKIRFRWNSVASAVNNTPANSGYGWIIDDVSITESYTNNLAILSSFTTVGPFINQYSKIPLGQTAAAGNVTFGASLRNTGAAALPATITATSGAFSETTSLPFIINPLGKADLTANDVGFPVPSVVGTTTFTITGTSPSPLSVVTDDAQTKALEVTPFIYATDRFTNIASISGGFTDFNGSVGDPAMGTYFEIFTTQTVYGMQVGIQNIVAADQAQYVGNVLNVSIHAMDFSDPVTVGSSPVAVNSNRIIAAIDFGKLIKIPFATGVVLTPGVYAAVAGGSPSNLVPIATSGSNIRGNTIVFQDLAFVGNWAGLPGTPELVTAPVVRLDFDPAVALESSTIAVTGMYPNPTTNKTELNINLANAGDVIVSVLDVAGKVVATTVYSSLNAGDQTISVDASALTAGMYHVNVTSNGATVSQKLIKK